MNKDSKYYEMMRQRCIYAKRSLERKLETLDAYSPEWEECYSQILETTDEMFKYSTLQCGAVREEMNKCNVG